MMEQSAQGSAATSCLAANSLSTSYRIASRSIVQCSPVERVFATNGCEPTTSTLVARTCPIANAPCMIIKQSSTLCARIATGRSDSSAFVRASKMRPQEAVDGLIDESIPIREVALDQISERRPQPTRNHKTPLTSSRRAAPR